MPQYPGIVGAIKSAPSNLSPIALQRGESHYLFGTLSTTATQLPVTDATVAQETVVAGESSIAVVLQPGAEGNPPPSVMLEGIFSGAPGTFEIDIQEADTDADAFYILPTGSSAYKITAVIAATNAFRVDLSPTGGKFLRANVVSLGNAVKLQLKATRMA